MALPKKKQFFRFHLPVIILLMAIPVFYTVDRERVYQAPELHDMRCAIAIKDQDDTTKALLAGFCYEILKSYGKESGFNMDIVLQKRGENYIDSIRNGSTDIIALPVYRTVETENFEMTSAVENMFVYCAAEEESAGLKDLGVWLDDFVKTTEYSNLKRRFFIATGSPFKRAASENPLNMAGPYDALIKKAASSIDWDWRMLSALIWQESKFRIDVVSRRGAEGLMQMMPATARKMGCENIVDPEDCIKTGANYISRLQNMFRPYAANRIELEKMTLAAYNAGEGRLQDCINFARSIGADCSSWDNIVKVIPQMNTDAVLQNDTVKLGKFKGLETIAYVDAVQDVYGAFCRICPDASLDAKALEPVSAE